MDLSAFCRKGLGLLGALAALGAPPARAADWQVYPPMLSNHFVNPRPAGMGEAFTAVADDQNALYYNPAGLARLGSWGIDYLEILNVMVAGTDYDLMAAEEVMKATKLDTSKIFSDKTEFDKFNEIFKKLKGNPYYARFGTNPFFVMKGFGLGLYLNNELGMSFHEGNTLARIEDLLDVDARVGYGRSFFGNKLSLGAAIAHRTRGHIDFNARVDEIDKFTSDKEFYKDVMKVGWGLPVDVGMMFTPVETWSPTLGVSVLNVGDTRFFKAAYAGAVSRQKPMAIPQSVNVGLSVTPRFGSKLFARGAVDFRDLNLPIAASRKFRLGFEGGFDRLLTVQTGVGEQGLSFGVEAKLFILNIRYATYGVERGYAAGQKPERRHLVGIKALL